MPAKEAPRIRWLVEPRFDQDGVQSTAGLDHYGREVGDPVPLSPPLGLSVSQGDELHTAIRNVFLRERAAFAAAVAAEDFETEEEANDFECPEDMFPPGNEPWEDVFEFPGEPGASANGSSLASGAVKGGSRGPEEPTPPATATPRTASADLASAMNPVPIEKTPTPVSGSVDTGRVDTPVVAPNTSRR